LGVDFQMAWAVLSAIWNIGSMVITRSLVPGSVLPADSATRQNPI